MSWIGWTNVVLGIWLVLSPFILNFQSNQAAWNNVIIGFIVIALAFVARNVQTLARGSM